MTGYIFAGLTIVCYVVMDFFVKKSAGKIDDTLGATIINIFAFLVPFVWYLSIKLSAKDMLVTRGGLVTSSIAGVAIGFGTVFFLKMFATGINFSIGVPLVRIGIVLLAFLVGILVLKENPSLPQIAGLVLALIGLYLVVAK